MVDFPPASSAGPGRAPAAGATPGCRVLPALGPAQAARRAAAAIC